MSSVPNNSSHRDKPATRQRGGLRRGIYLANEGWKRQRMLSALESVNDHWLEGVGIDTNNIEDLVDKVVQREIPMPIDAVSGF